MAAAAILEMIYFLFLLIVVLVASHLYLFHHFPPVPMRNKEHVYDTLIVLGCPSNADGSLSSLQKKRMDASIHTFQQHCVKTLLISGGNAHNAYVEAEAMAAYAKKAGIPDACIFLEKKARNTYENLRYAKEICDQQGFQDVLVMTSPSHVRRASFFVRKFFPVFAMDCYNEKVPVWKRIEEYFRMWNTLWYEWKLRHK